MTGEQPLQLPVSEAAAHKLDDIRSDVSQQSLVDMPMAWDIAHAQKEHMDELVESGRSLSLDRAFRLGVLAERASQKVEQAYRDGVEYAPGSTQATNVASPPKSVELMRPAHPVAERLNKNLAELEHRAVGILIGLRVPDTDHLIKTDRLRYDGYEDAYCRFEDVDLYDLDSGSLIHIQLRTQEMPGKEDLTLSWDISDTLTPMAGTEPGKRVVHKGLSYSRDIQLQPNPTLRDCQGSDMFEGLHNDDPQLIENWLTRLTGGVPVTEDEAKELFTTHKKAFGLESSYRGKTIKLSSSQFENTDSRSGRKLLQTLHNRRAALSANRYPGLGLWGSRTN